MLFEVYSAFAGQKIHFNRDAVKIKSAKFRDFVLNWLTPFPLGRTKIHNPNSWATIMCPLLSTQWKLNNPTLLEDDPQSGW